MGGHPPDPPAEDRGRGLNGGGVFEPARWVLIKSRTPLPSSILKFKNSVLFPHFLERIISNSI